MSTEATPSRSGGSLPPEEPDQPRRKRWGCLAWVFVAVILLLGVGFVVPVFNVVSYRAPVMQASSNCRQILISLKAYAGDHEGRYPDGKTANDAFRELIKAELMDDERAFTVSLSPYDPDNDIGEAPDFAQALEPGENHWAMTRGLTDEASGIAPLIFENPAQASWPPFWNADLAGQKEPGRTWKSGKIVVGRNDGSVAAEPLSSDSGPAVSLKKDSDGKDLFEHIGPHEIMDVAR